MAADTIKVPGKKLTKGKNAPKPDPTKAKVMAKAKRGGNDVKIAPAPGNMVQGAAPAMPSPAMMADMKKSISKDKGSFKR